MENCDGFFEGEGIPYEPEYEDAAVRAVKVADFHDPAYKKWLIICWFDTTYGEWTDATFDMRDARAKMSDYLARTSYSNYEQLLAAPDASK